MNTTTTISICSYNRRHPSGWTMHYMTMPGQYSTVAETVHLMLVSSREKFSWALENLRSDQSKLSVPDWWVGWRVPQTVCCWTSVYWSWNESPDKSTTALLVLWVINPPKETAISGTNHQRFSDYAHRAFAENVVNILSNLTPEMMKVKKISPNTMEQCLSLYEITSGTLDAQFTQMLIDNLFKQVSGMEPALQKILRRLITWAEIFSLIQPMCCDTSMNHQPFWRWGWKRTSHRHRCCYASSSYVWWFENAVHWMVCSTCSECAWGPRIAEAKRPCFLCFWTGQGKSTVLRKLFLAILGQWEEEPRERPNFSGEMDNKLTSFFNSFQDSTFFGQGRALPVDVFL